MSRKSTAKPSGTTVVLEYDSRVLAGNPLGDPHVRKLAVWLPPGYDEGTLRGSSAGADAASRCCSTSWGSPDPDLRI